MSKMKLNWHRAVNLRHAEHVARLKGEVDRVRAQYVMAESDMKLRNEQYETAMAEGKDGYDPERYLIKRKTK